jgi:predicted dehydrogenase
MKKRSLVTNRRAFLKVAAGAAACPYVITSAALGAGARPPASERIVMGGIGIGSQGGGDMGAFLGRDDVQYVATCDVRRGVREGALNRINQRYNNKDGKAYTDFRELLGRTDIDAVHIATPDHWHAIMIVEACRNGKDVFCQKPETRTLGEGPQVVAAARRYGRVVSGGSQRVLEDYKDIVKKCWGGELGAIKSINVNVGPLSKPCDLPAEPVPPDMDWEMWLGPAPWAPYNKKRCDGNFSTSGGSWRSYDDYSGGGMTDWGAHHFGGATFTIDVREMDPVYVTYHNEKGSQYLTFHYPNGVLLTHNRPGKGNLDVEGTPGQTRPPKEIPQYKGHGGIHGDFIQCCKTREKPFRDIELAIHTMAVCHLGIIAYAVKRSLKWDSAKQQIAGDEEANRMIDRAKREPWVL